MVTSSTLALGFKTAALINNLWPGFTLGSFSSSSAVSAGSSGFQVYSLEEPEREQDHKYSCSALLSWIMAAILRSLVEVNQAIISLV